MAELKPWRTEGQQARTEKNHGGYILKIKHRVSQTHRSSSQLKTFMSTDEKWAPLARRCGGSTRGAGDRATPLYGSRLQLEHQAQETSSERSSRVRNG